MRRPLLATLVAVTVVLAVAACSDVTSPDDRALVGRWMAEPQAGQPRGSYETTVVFRANGAYLSEWRAISVYPGQPAGQLSAYSRSYGRYQAGGGRFVVAVDSVVTWDRFYGADSRPTVTRPAPGGQGGVYDGGGEGTSYEISGGTLTLRYLSYPADAPVPTTQRLTRVR